jgi:hypothetical protein
MNTVVSAAEGKAAFSRLSMVTERFLNISLDYLGCKCLCTIIFIISGTETNTRGANA